MVKTNDEGRFNILDCADEQIYLKFENGEVLPVINSYDQTPLTLGDFYNKAREDKLKGMNKKQAFTDTELINLKGDRSRGMSIRELARKYDKSTATIQKYLKK